MSRVAPACCNPKSPRTPARRGQTSVTPSFPPSERVAESHSRRVGFVQGQRLAVPEQGHDRPRHLLLAGMAASGHGLLHAQGGIFKDLVSRQRGGGDGRAAGGAENLGRLEILDVDRLLQRHVARQVEAQHLGHRPVDLPQTVGHRPTRRDLHRPAVQENRGPAGGKLDQRQARAAQAGINPQHAAREGAG